MNYDPHPHISAPVAVGSKCTHPKIELLSVVVLSAKEPCSIPIDWRMLRYMFDIRDSPFRQYVPCLRPILAPPAINVGKLRGLCVVLAPLPNITIVVSSKLLFRS